MSQPSPIFQINNFQLFIEKSPSHIRGGKMVDFITWWASFPTLRIDFVVFYVIANGVKQTRFILWIATGTNVRYPRNDNKFNSYAKVSIVLS